MNFDKNKLQMEGRGLSLQDAFFQLSVVQQDGHSYGFDRGGQCGKVPAECAGCGDESLLADDS